MSGAEDFRGDDGHRDPPIFAAATCAIPAQRFRGAQPRELGYMPGERAPIVTAG
ncbi:hypothetical protein [Nocardia noduli]|uniref:hypothetical protein n=1 Tax=Nocardia noduli TaxID=2815722 RepID=UPI001C230576|nr:hypothetical protein [Nocardia noduli]